MKKFFILAVSLSALVSFSSCSENEEQIDQPKVNKNGAVEITLSTKSEGGKVVYTYTDTIYCNGKQIKVNKFTDTLPVIGDTLVAYKSKPKNYTFYVTVK